MPITAIKLITRVVSKTNSGTCQGYSGNQSKRQNWENVCGCVCVPAQCTVSLQLASQQSSDGGETVAHPVDVFSPAAQDGGVAISQAADFQQ